MGSETTPTASRSFHILVVAGLILSQAVFALWWLDVAPVPQSLLILSFAMLGIALVAMRYSHRIAELYIAQSSFIIEAREGWLKEMVDHQAHQSGLACAPRCIVYEDDAVNAFVAGTQAARANLFISSSALTRLSKHRLNAIIAHEISHIRNGDMVALSIIQGLFACLALPLWLIWFIVRCCVPRGRGLALRLALRGTYWMALLAAPLASMAMLLILRRWEFEADRRASYQVGAQGFVETLRCLHHAQRPPATQMASNGFVQSFFERVPLSHPTLDRRIKALQALRQV